MNTSTADCKATTQKPAPVVFHRRRILYAPPIFDSKGKIQFGMKSRESGQDQLFGPLADIADVLNRFPSSTSLAHTTHVLKYIFPKQFGLHNVFSSVSNGQDIFKDYAYREDEIAKLEKAKRAHPNSESMIPRRLQGKAVELVQQLQNRNKHCSYVHLLNYYCPAEVCSLIQR